MAKDKAKDKQAGSAFHPEGARRLLEGVAEKLNDDERALLLALIGTDAETGKSFSEEERAALDKLIAQLEDYDAEELIQAVQYMVTSQSRGNQKLEWPELKRGRRKRRPPGE